MNVIGVLLSAACLIVALFEMRVHGDQPGRRLSAMVFAAVSWLTMGAVALDQSWKCQMLREEQLSKGSEDVWQYTSPDGSMYQSRKYLAGTTESWHAKPNEQQ